MLNAVLKIKAKRKKFSIIKGKQEIKQLIDRLPSDDECFKFISTGGFSSASFIGYVAEHTVIRKLYVSTFRIGKKEIKFLHALHESGRLQEAEFVVFSLAKRKR